jgi:hypothetical protein
VVNHPKRDIASRELFVAEVNKINEARIIYLDESCIENNATKEMGYRIL